MGLSLVYLTSPNITSLSSESIEVSLGLLRALIDFAEEFDDAGDFPEARP